MLQQQRQAKYDEAERHLSRLAEQGELPASGVVRMMQQLTRAFELVPLGQAVTTAELVDFAQKVLLSAKTACLQGSTCDADLVSSSVLDSYRAAKARQVEALRAAAAEACEKEFLTCDPSLLSEKERALIEKRRVEHASYPPRWRLPAGFEKALVGPDTAMYFGAGFFFPASVSISRSTIIEGGREVVFLSYRADTHQNLRRWSLRYKFDLATGSFLEVQEASWAIWFYFFPRTQCSRVAAEDHRQGGFSSFLDPQVFVMALSLGVSAPEHPIHSGSFKGYPTSVLDGTTSGLDMTIRVAGNVRKDGFRVLESWYANYSHLLKPQSDSKKMNPWKRDPASKCKF
jgi:hypothetical protein